jgi:DNA-binding NarL/FixJ family response regulator
MRVLLIDSQPIFREGLLSILAKAPGLIVVGTAGTAREGLARLESVAPQVVLLDLSLPDGDGPGTTRELKRLYPSVDVIILGGRCHERDVIDTLAAGASAFIARSDPAECLLEALGHVAGGRSYLGRAARALALPPDISGLKARELLASGDLLAPLSPREREVFHLILKGLRNHEMAQLLGISVKTVDTHRTRLNRKLGCSSTADLIRFAIANGLFGAHDRVGARSAFA